MPRQKPKNSEVTMNTIVVVVLQGGKVVSVVGPFAAPEEAARLLLVHRFVQENDSNVWWEPRQRMTAYVQCISRPGYPGTHSFPC